MSGPKYAFSILAQKLRRSLSQHGLIKTVQAARAFARRCLQQRLLVLRAASVRREPPRVDRGVILIVDHDWGGGASAWRQARAQSLLKEGRCVLIWQYLAAVNRHLLEWRAGNESRLYAGGNLKQVMAFVRKAAPERIICNELVGWDRIEAVLTFLRALQSAGSRLEVPIHDYFAVCPTIVLLDRDNAYCGVPDIRRCSTCLPGHPLKPRGTPDDIAPWRQAWGTFLASADEVLVPDQSVREILGKAYPTLPARTVLAPHEPLAPWKPLPLGSASAPSVIGLIGTINQAKGAALVCELATLVQEKMPEARMLLMGALEASTPPRNLQITGPYLHADLPRLLQSHGVTVCLVPSICPETFCYVAQEIEQLGLPLVCLDLGAQGRRARAYAKGIVAKTPDAQGCLEAIRKLEKRRRTGAWRSSTADGCTGP